MFHNYIGQYITRLFDNIYYKNLKKVYNEDISKILQYNKILILKPEYFIYAKSYFMYLFFYYMTYKRFIFYSLFLHLLYISDIVYEGIIKKYEYKPKNNMAYLQNTLNILFAYLFLLKIIFFDIYSFKKVILISSESLFFLIYNIRDVYRERLKCIENKNIEFKHPLKILIISPNKKFIENTVRITYIFTIPNFLIFINILLFFMI